MAEILIIKDGVRYTVKSGNANDFHTNLPAIKGDISNMEASHGEGVEQMQFSRPDKWNIKKVFGDTHVNIYGGVSKKKEKEKQRFIEQTTFTRIVPYLRSPDGDGVLLNMSGVNFDGKFKRLNIYDVRAGSMTLPYAPYAYPETDENTVYPTSGYATLPELKDDETLLEFRIQQPDKHYVSDWISEFVYTGPQLIMDSEYEEPKWYGGGMWAPAMYKDYSVFNDLLYAYQYEGGDAPPSDLYGMTSSTETNITRDETDVLLWFLFGYPLGISGEYNWTRSYYHRTQTSNITIAGANFGVSGGGYYDEYVNQGGDAPCFWHTISHPDTGEYYEDANGPCPNTPDCYYYHTIVNDFVSIDFVAQYARASNLVDAWACLYKIYRVNTNYLKYLNHSYASTPLGTECDDYYVETTEEDITTEYYYADSDGANVLLDTQDGYGTGSGLCKLYRHRANDKDDEHMVGVFCYDGNWREAEGYKKIAGVAVKGEVTISDISTIEVADADNTTYTPTSVINSLGIIAVTTTIANTLY